MLSFARQHDLLDEIEQQITDLRSAVDESWGYL